MAQSMIQMAAKRRANRVTMAEIQRRLNCSYSWVRWLENGYYRGPCVKKWRDRYEEALKDALKERKARLAG